MTELQALIHKAGRVAVLYGGTSSERSVSLDSGQACVQALTEAGFNVVPIDIGADALAQIVAAKPDCAFIALHGPGGEDGKIQALLEFLQIPYTGSGVAASALCMDKLRTKQLWCGVGLSTPPYRLLQGDSDWQAVFELGAEIIVKPSREGSSYGVTRVSNAAELADAYRAAAAFDDAVLAEKYINGGEYTVAILAGEALPPIKLETDHRFYDFAAKYQADDTRYICPCGLPEAQEQTLKTLALAAFAAVGADGWGRVDVMCENNEFYLLEVNTVPGMTSHSLVPMAAHAAGISMKDLVVKILQQALRT